VVAGGVRLGALVTARPGSAELQAAVGDYLLVLEGTAATVRARISRPDQISGSELRLLHAALREASARVEAVLLADVQSRYRVQREVQRLAIVLVGALLLIVIAFRYHAMTRRREAVVRVVASEERLRAFVSAMPDVALMLDRDGRYLEVFGTAASLLLRPREHLLGATVFDVLPAAVAQGFVDVIRRAIAGGGVLCHEYELEIDGSVHCFEARVSPVGELDQVVWLSRDVTERRRAEERNRLHSVALEGTRDGIMVTDAQGRILSVNPALGAITGYHGDELIGATPQVLKSGRHDVAFFRNLWATLQRDGHWQGELWIRRKNGDVAPQWVSISAVTDAGGHVAQ
jgi:PAS domain S-box-containing protein